MNNWLLIDCLYLCHRSWHTTGHLSFNREATGVAFGFLRDLEILNERFFPDITVFAFDSGGLGIRGGIDPTYKSTRRNKVRSEEEQEEYRSFKQQVKKLQGKLIPKLGYKNIYQQRGYEADDILAYFSEKIPGEDHATIVTADNDLWQCLADNVNWYNPTSKKLIIRKDFQEKWNLDPAMWASVKAMAGCKTDDIKGIEGIGEVYASKWFSGELKKGSNRYNKILEEGIEIHNRNIKLTRLPLDGLDFPEIQPDEVTEKKKLEVQIELGIRSGRKVKRKSKSKLVGFDI